MLEVKKNAKPAMSDSLMRSFGRVQGRRLGFGQQWFVDNIFPKVAVDVEKQVNLSEIFDHKYKQFCVEIGFGRGEHLAGYAKLNNEVGFIGCEPFINGVARLVRYIHEENIQNVKVLHGDARILLDKLPDGCLDKIFILFPDPWPKIRHHKKRIVNNEMLAEICRVLKAGGILEVATDHAQYGKWIAQHLESCSGLKEEAISTTPPDDWVRTNYQEKAEKQGRGARFFRYSKV